MYRIPRRTALDVASSVAGKGSAFGAPAEAAVGTAEAAVSVFASSDAVSSMHHERSDVLDDCDAPDIVAPSDLRQHCLEMRNDECQRA